MDNSIWRPMSEAPKDGRLIALDCGDGNVGIGLWAEVWILEGYIVAGSGAVRSAGWTISEPLRWAELPRLP